MIKILNPDERDPVVAAISHLYNDIGVDVKAEDCRLLFEELLGVCLKRGVSKNDLWNVMKHVAGDQEEDLAMEIGFFSPKKKTLNSPLFDGLSSDSIDRDSII